MELFNLIDYAIENRASDIHFTVGVPPILRIDGALNYFNEEKLNSEDIKKIVREILDREQFNELESKGEIDTSYSRPGVSRFRVNIYKQRGSYAIALRIIPFRIPTMQELGLPKVAEDLSRLPRGLILVTGPTGSGKSTTLASMINLINEERNCHILTLEDPIEYLHKHNRSMVNQREIGTDSNSFANALRAALRQDPDVILVGEMRDLETISIALTAAETGHLVLSTLHTVGAAKTIDRVVDVFAPYQQQQIRVQLASVLQAIISQQLLPKSNDKGRIAVFETMVATPAIRNLIREEKIHQIDTVIQTSRKQGMKTMDQALIELFQNGLISKEIVLSQAASQDIVKKYVF